MTDSNPQPSPSALHGAIDLHVHCAPDVVPRAQDAFDLARAAHAAGMRAIGLKDHTTSTIGRCHVLNRMYPDGPCFLSSLVLNPQIGGLNPGAVEAALQGGVDIIYFPTYSAQHHIDCLGPDISPVPHPKAGLEGIRIVNSDGALLPKILPILAEIAHHNAILATGHLSPQESLVLLSEAAKAGVQRMIVTHASESVPDMSVDDQKLCVELGAMIEHSLLAATPCCPGTVPMETIAEQIREVGIEHCIVSSDFGQVDNGPPVAAFEHHLKKLAELGFSESEIHRLIAENPSRLVFPPGD